MGLEENENREWSAPLAISHRFTRPVESPVAVSAPSSETAALIFAHLRVRLAPYKRIRRLEFAELPKTISGKIRRVELRRAEELRTERAPHEYWEEDFPELTNQG